MEELRLNLMTSNEGEEIYIEPADPVETFLDSPNTYMQQFNELDHLQGSVESKESSFQWAKDLMKRGKAWYKSLSPEEKRKLKEKLKVAGKYLKEYHLVHATLPLVSVTLRQGKRRVVVAIRHVIARRNANARLSVIG
ncbi:unnamed protein product, partial [Mesorhabditis spiculigera]